MGGLRRVGPAACHDLHWRVELLVRVAEHVLKDRVEYLDQRFMGPERLAERKDLSLGIHLTPEPREVPHVAAPEAIDGLLDIADEEPLRSRGACILAS